MRRAKKTQDFARQLRRNLTHAETILWSRLKGRQLGGHHIRRQHVVGPFIADFACCAARLLIEVDGSDHATSWREERDTARDLYLVAEGWTVVRVTNQQVRSALPSVLNAIEQAITFATQHPGQ